MLKDHHESNEYIAIIYICICIHIHVDIYTHVCMYVLIYDSLYFKLNFRNKRELKNLFILVENYLRDTGTENFLCSTP